MDQFAQFSLRFLENEVGIGAVHPRSIVATYALLDPALNVVLNGHPLPRTRFKCSPSWVSEEADGPLHVRTETRFENARRAEIKFEIENRSIAPQFADILLNGEGNEDHPGDMLALFPGSKIGQRRFYANADKDSVHCTLRDPTRESDLPSVGIRLSCAGSRCQVDGNRYSFSLECQIGAGEVFRFSVVIEIDGVNFIDEAPPSNADSVGDLGGVLGRARLALLRCGIWGGGGTFGNQVASLCTGDQSDFSSSFFWDTLFSSVAIASFHPTYARGALLTAFAGQDPADGATPERKWNRSSTQPTNIRSPQSPIGSWAAREVARITGDQTVLQDAFPLLWRNHEFWEKHSDRDGDGLAEYVWSGQAADDSPLWDGYPRDGVFGCSWLPPVASVALNSFLAWDARHLAAIANELGHTHEACSLLQSAEQRVEALNRHCFVPDENRYWDFDHRKGSHCKVKTFYMFWPLVMGLDVPRSTVEDLIENVLLDPRQFFGPVPFPSVAYDEPTYDPGGYWRGRAWPHISYWLITTLWRLGYTAEADLAATRTLAALQKEPGFPENLVSDPESKMKAGFFDYNWGAATACLLTDKSYQRSILTEFHKPEPCAFPTSRSTPLSL